ncbi:hypothetical protein BDN71DRAFT_1434394 [Pleurotus eryngii]|uniref:Uncharacterized protein n=1 Tax=Pleurotus eryngii TaxID=5323 RepID=A0A9P6DBL5_PLEER|nr:hypothetical protein BDN71DRAFT_1434394 [Pleurotus eryngii]
MLCKQYVLADKQAADAENTRDEITEHVGVKNITAWTNAVVEAENTCYIDLSVMDIYGIFASYEDHMVVPAEDEPLNGNYQWIREAIEVQELQVVLGIEGSNIHNVDPLASMMGTEPLPGDTLFSNLNDFEPPDNDINVDNEESSDEADVSTVLTAAVAFSPLAEHPT